MAPFLQELSLHHILAEAERRGITLDHLLTIPEQDDWVYSDGKSTTCVAFILGIYKAAGIFEPFSSSIQVTEFTVSPPPPPPPPLDLPCSDEENGSQQSKSVGKMMTKKEHGADPGRVHAEVIRGQPDSDPRLVQRREDPLLPDPRGVPHGAARVQHRPALRLHERALPLAPPHLRAPAQLLTHPPPPPPPAHPCMYIYVASSIC